MTLVAVYGSLRAGMANAGLLEGEQLGGCQIEDVELYAYAPSYPAAVHVAGALTVGELWDVSLEVLDRLDRLEGHPRFYARSAMTVRWWLGRHRMRSRAWVYLLPRSGVSGRERIASGDWVEYRRR